VLAFQGELFEEPVAIHRRAREQFASLDRHLPFIEQR
jgi:hypothetical protein